MTGLGLARQKPSEQPHVHRPWAVSAAGRAGLRDLEGAAHDRGIDRAVEVLPDRECIRMIRDRRCRGACGGIVALFDVIGRSQSLAPRVQSRDT